MALSQLAEGGHSAFEALDDLALRRSERRPLPSGHLLHKEPVVSLVVTPDPLHPVEGGVVEHRRVRPGLPEALEVLPGRVEHLAHHCGYQRQSADRLPGRSPVGDHGCSVSEAVTAMMFGPGWWVVPSL